MNSNYCSMKHLLRLFYISMSLVLLISCKEETSYRMEILLKNGTNSKQVVQLFPKAQYLKDGRDDLYLFSSGYGDCKYTYCDIEPGESNCLFITTDLDQIPSVLALQVFDSIHIVPYSDSLAIIRFYPDSVHGYNDNLFNENSKWIYKMKHQKEPTNFSENPIELHEYTFVIE